MSAGIADIGSVVGSAPTVTTISGVRAAVYSSVADWAASAEAGARSAAALAVVRSVAAEPVRAGDAGLDLSLGPRTVCG